MIRALPGIWTPWAAILTYAEHGATGPVTTAGILQSSKPRARREGEGLTRSTQSGKWVWVAEAVAAVNNARLRLQDLDYNAILVRPYGMRSLVAVYPASNRVLVVGDAAGYGELTAEAYASNAAWNDGDRPLFPPATFRDDDPVGLLLWVRRHGGSP